MAAKEPQSRIDILQGTLGMLILQILQWGPQHGLDIARIIRTRSEDLLRIEAGSLYPALHRLEAQGWVASEWKISAKGQHAKFYKLTRAGKKQLAAEQSRWERLLRAIRLVMKPTQPRDA